MLKSREAAKRCHESRVEANTRTSPIGKGSNDLSALTVTAVRKVTVRDHLVCVCVLCVCVCVCVRACACVQVTRITASGK